MKDNYIGRACGMQGLVEVAYKILV
jgi:hypothetical protein